MSNDPVMPQEASTLQMPAIEAGCCTVAGLFAFDETYSVSIPDYQRPYVWSAEQVSQLLKDLNGFFSPGAYVPGQYYYIGSLLLYRENDDLAIIDGQQRITTLLMLDYILNRENSQLSAKQASLHLTYNNLVSRQNIARNQQYILDNKYQYDQLPPDFLGRLVFSVIITNLKDNAFTFFVTQNNRGVPLAATDLLKSFHLRALENQEQLQRHFAKGWDAEQTQTNIPWLFDKLLWRGRKWRGKVLEFENRKLLLKEFQDNQIKVPQGFVPLYAGPKNQLASALTFSPKQQVHLQIAPVLLGQQAAEYPFSFRQPIAPGAGFFLYTEHFTALYHLLFDQGEHAALKNGLPEVSGMNNFYRQVYLKCGLNNYLQDLFKLCMLLYYNQFGEDGLFAFTLWLDYYIGAYRIGQRNIMAQTAMNMVKDPDQNLFDVITSAYLPNEIFQFLRKSCQSWKYKKEYKVNSVRAAYIQALERYYDNSLTTTNKKQLIHAKLLPAQT